MGKIRPIRRLIARLILHGPAGVGDDGGQENDGQENARIGDDEDETGDRACGGVKTFFQKLRDGCDAAAQVFRKEKRAMNTRDKPATTSHAMTAMPSVNAAPLSPTSCSVERLVSNNDPAM